MMASIIFCSKRCCIVGGLFGFYGISILVGYLMSNPFSYNKSVLFQTIGPSATHSWAAQARWGRSTAMVTGRTLGQYVAVCLRLQLTSHTQPTSTLLNKVWEVYFYKEVCSFVHWSLSSCFYLHLHVWVYNTCLEDNISIGKVQGNIFSDVWDQQVSMIWSWKWEVIVEALRKELGGCTATALGQQITYREATLKVNTFISFRFQYTHTYSG